MRPDVTALYQGHVLVNVLRLEEEDEEIVSRVRAGIGGTLGVLRDPEPSVPLLTNAGFPALGWHRRGKAMGARVALVR